MVFWCLFAFVTSGFEHSIANMALLTIGLLVNHGDIALETVNLAGLAHNLIHVTVGTMVGGIGLAFVFLAINGHKQAS